MWVESFKDKNNKTKYRYYEKYKDPMTDKWRRVSVVLEKNTKASQKEAQRQLDKRVVERINALNGVIEKKTLTFSQALTEWLEHYKVTTQPKYNTIRTYSSLIDLIKNNINTDILIDRITFKYLQNEFNKLNRRKLAETTMLLIVNIVKRTFEFTKKKYGLAVECVNDIEISRNIKRKKREFLEMDELRKIMDYFEYKSSEYPHFRRVMKYRCAYCFVGVQALTGMRGGEVSALRPENISLKNSTIEVNGTMLWIYGDDNKRGIKGDPKTTNSNRIITIDKNTKKLLERRFEDLKLLKKECDYFQDRGYVFSSVFGNPIQLLDINRALSEACKACGIQKNITSHSLRHTHISLLAQLGIPIKAIMNRVGHSDYKTTLAVYTHVTEKMEQDLMNKLGQIKL